MTLNAFIFAGVFVTFFIIVELAKRGLSIKPERTRKVVHIVSSLLIVAMPLFVSAVEIIMLAGAFIILLITTRYTGSFSAVQGVKRKTVGEFTLPLGAVLAAYFYLPSHAEAFQVGFVVLAFSDTLAEWVGTKWTWVTLQIMGGEKSLGGSIAFFLSALVLMSGLALVWGAEVNQVKLFAGLVLMTAVELSQSFGIDNMFIPVSTALVWDWAMDM